MSHKLFGTVALAALIAAGSAFAADAPQAAPSTPAAATAAAPTAEVPATPPAVSSTPASTPTPAPSAAPAASAPANPAPAPAPMATMPAKMEKPYVSACTRAIRSAEHDLKVSKAKPEAIAGAWQHIQAAKQARGMRNKDACKSEAAAASKMSQMM
jgi:hypothetical protein